MKLPVVRAPPSYVVARVASCQVVVAVLKAISVLSLVGVGVLLASSPEQAAMRMAAVSKRGAESSETTCSRALMVVTRLVCNVFFFIHAKVRIKIDITKYFGSFLPKR